ncbi:MAG: hypothetical protein U0361_25235 [Nitrospiraceae bacterium]
MKGEFVPVWAEMWDAVWTPIATHDAAPNDLFCELYRELAKSLANPPTIEVLADIIDSPEQSLEVFKAVDSREFRSERALVAFLEAAYAVFEDIGGDNYANEYFNSLEQFVGKYSLRYDLRRPCLICPTLPGLFASLVNDLKVLTGRNDHLHELMRDFEAAVRTLRTETTGGQIKSCIQKQINLMEAIARQHPGVTQKTLGAMCDQLATWPHAGMKVAMKEIYWFTNDYPGIRHGGTPENALRAIDMRDLLAVSIMLAGFVPYLAHEINPEQIYGAG